MISEVANALFLTFIATEYQLSTSFHQPTSGSFTAASGSFTKSYASMRRHGRLYACSATIVFLINLLDYLSHDATASRALRHAAARLWHVPRVTFAACMYVLVLYLDCLRLVRAYGPAHVSTGRAGVASTMGAARRRWPFRRFLRRLARAFVYVAPVYPLLAIGISVVFLVVVNVWEALGIPVRYLQAPIYYGTLYGPFSYMYSHVKRHILGDQVRALPT